jgi:sodium-dependent dicarboxylate transporter 2/3/5
MTSAKYPSLRTVFVLMGPSAFAAVAMGPDLVPGRPEATAMAAILAWVAIWWFTEPVDLAVTAFLPFLLIPIMGIASPGETASQYMDPIIFLFIGGFMLALGMEKWQLHTRFALGILSRTGAAPHRILLGVMLAAFGLSMWVSNTATVLMLLPAVMAVMGHVGGGERSDELRPLGIALMLGLAYAATIGGMTTLVGTPPNMYFYSFYQRIYPEDASVNFASFFGLAIVITVSMLTLTYLLIRLLHLRGQRVNLDRQYFRGQFAALGKLSLDQKVIFGVFLLTVLAWFTRPDMTFGDYVWRGWASRIGMGSVINDGMVVIAACILLFVLPSSKSGHRMLEWRDMHKLPFGIILLFGSGFALAMGFEQSGLSEWFALRLRGISDVHPFVFLLAVGLVVTTISEFASNIACVQLLLPVLASLADDSPLPAKGLLLATTLFASMGFMMPVATAPNTIVMGSGLLRTSDMARTGFLVNMSGVLIISLVFYVVFG